ncbi:GNAT family N-acetyltransferase [Paenibacillus soyae]|uniref:GNAT family N-acetyltransferase n=1 Tax=Paenibacillus soyae TaxID=2969249 RepID=A0A9X2MND4_9BACL|nr:GNAT family protein [Paenibacillus soyae]MCR2803485.1 GNAT family N-acetyltransferase [Paenibacillus soyae]
MRRETERLILREFTAGDWEAVHRYASDPVVTSHMIWGPNTEADTRAFLESAIGMQQQAPRVDFELAVVLKENGELIGGSGLRSFDPRQGEIGYCFNRSHWRNGYASEAASELLRFGFEELGLHRIFATCRPDNLGSAAVMRKIGMTFEGHMRGHMFHKGKFHDSHQYSILEDEYFAGKKKGHSL